MDFSELLHGFVKIDTWISKSYYMEFVEFDTWISLSCYRDLLKLLHGFRCFYRPSPNKTKLKFDHDFKGC